MIKQPELLTSRQARAPEHRTPAPGCITLTFADPAAADVVDLQLREYVCQHHRVVKPHANSQYCEFPALFRFHAFCVGELRDGRGGCSTDHPPMAIEPHGARAVQWLRSPSAVHVVERFFAMASDCDKK
jgi:hypothetical protein